MEFVTFKIEDQDFAVALAYVELVVLAVELIPLPHSPANVCGAVNVRGEIVPVISIRKVLGLPQREMELSDQFIICVFNGSKIAFWVDSVRDVVDYKESQMLPPEMLSSVGKHVSHVIKDGRTTILVCDWEKLCHQNLAAVV